ncbi:MAG: TlpA disulfide reductase family protein [Pyrinomonadaceae bacterium]
MKSYFIVHACMFLAIALTTTVHAQDGHEYAPIEEKTVHFKNFSLKSLTDDKSIDLRQWTADKKLVLVVYFAEWCPNWRNEAPFVAKLSEQYGSQGLGIIAVSEYASPGDVRKHFGDQGAPYTVVIESERRSDREKTPHYTYRQATGDARRWGSPYHIFLEPAHIAKEGDVLIEKAWAVNGELIEAETEKFVRERLEKKQAN